MERSDIPVEEQPLYTSHHRMDRDNYYDFSTINYKKLKRDYSVSFSLSVIVVLLNILSHTYVLAAALPVTMLLIYFLLQRNIILGYRRTQLVGRPDLPMETLLMADHVITRNEEGARAFSYQQVVGLFETKRFLLIHLGYNVYIPLSKANLSDTAAAVQAFLLQNCPNLKKKKCIDCRRHKAICLALLIAAFAVSAAATALTIAANR